MVLSWKTFSMVPFAFWDDIKLKMCVKSYTDKKEKMKAKFDLFFR